MFSSESARRRPRGRGLRAVDLDDVLLGDLLVNEELSHQLALVPWSWITWPSSGSSTMVPLQLNFFLHSLRITFLLILGLMPWIVVRDLRPLRCCVRMWMYPDCTESACWLSFAGAPSSSAKSKLGPARARRGEEGGSASGARRGIGRGGTGSGGRDRTIRRFAAVPPKKVSTATPAPANGARGGTRHARGAIARSGHSRKARRRHFARLWFEPDPRPFPPGKRVEAGAMPPFARCGRGNDAGAADRADRDPESPRRRAPTRVAG